jgi:hypothetical protein
LLGVFASLAVIGSVVILSAGPAQTSCIQPLEEGHWRNADPNTNSLTRIHLRFVCQDVILNGEPYPPGPPWYVHLWGKCAPSDCDWGEVGARELSGGHIFAFYDQGFAKRYVYAKMSIYRPGQLWVYTWTDFVDPGRSDYGVHNWYVRE